MRYLALLLLCGCASHEDLLMPDEFHAGVWEADLDHKNSVFDGDQRGVGLGLTWRISGPTAAESAMAGLPEKMDNLLERVEPTESLPSPEPSSEDSDLLQLLLVGAGSSLLTGGGIAGYKKIKE